MKIKFINKPNFTQAVVTIGVAYELKSICEGSGYFQMKDDKGMELTFEIAYLDRNCFEILPEGQSENIDEEKLDDKLEVGDIVQLKSGGPYMTVKSFNYSGHPTCIWFDEKEGYSSYQFEEKTLNKVGDK